MGRAICELLSTQNATRVENSYVYCVVVSSSGMSAWYKQLSSGLDNFLIYSRSTSFRSGATLICVLMEKLINSRLSVWYMLLYNRREKEKVSMVWKCIIQVKKKNKKYHRDTRRWAVCHWMEKRRLKKSVSSIVVLLCL